MEKFDDNNPKPQNNGRQDNIESKSGKFKEHYKNNNYSRDSRKYENKSSFNRYNNFYETDNRLNNFDRNDWNDNYRSSINSRYSWTRNNNSRKEESKKRSYSPLKFRKKNDYYSNNNSNINRGYDRDKNDLQLSKSRSPYNLLPNSSKTNKQQEFLSNKNKSYFNKKYNKQQIQDKNKLFKNQNESNKLNENEINNCKKPNNIKKPNIPGKRKQNIFKIIENNRKKNVKNIIQNSIKLINDNNNLEIINNSNNIDNNLNNNSININPIITTTPKISLVPLTNLLREELIAHFDEIKNEISSTTTTNEQNQINNNNNKNDKNLESLTNKLLNKVAKMDKINIKNIINNPSEKFDAALKFRASQRFRDEIRKQLRALQIENPNLNTKCNNNNYDGDFESENFINDNNIPQLILDQIQQSLGIEFLQEIANETAITTPITTLENNDNIINTTIINNDGSTLSSSSPSSSSSSIVIQDIILPTEKIPSSNIIESNIINETTPIIIDEHKNLDLSKSDLLKKLINFGNTKISPPPKQQQQQRTTTTDPSTIIKKCNNTSPLKDTIIKSSSSSSPKIIKTSQKKFNNNINNNNRKKSSINTKNNNDILTISSTSSSSSSSSSSDSDDSSSTSSSSTSSSNNSSTYKKNHHRYNHQQQQHNNNNNNNQHHRKDKEIQVVDRFKKLILPTLSIYLRKKYNDKYSKNLTNSLSFIYDICLNKLMKNSNLGSYEKKVLKKNLKSNNNDGALEYLLKNIEELHEQNEKYKKKSPIKNNIENNNNNKNIEKSSSSIIINSNNKSINDLKNNNNNNKPLNQISKINIINTKIQKSPTTKTNTNSNNDEQIDNSVIEAAVQNSKFIAIQLKKIAQQKIDERNKEKLLNKKLSISSSSSNADDVSNPNGNSSSSSIKTNLINEPTNLISNDNNLVDENLKNNKTQNCDEKNNKKICQNNNKKQMVILDKPAQSAGNHQKNIINKELIQQNECNNKIGEIVKSNILPILSKYDDENVNDKATTNNNNKNLLIEKNPIGKVNPVKEIDDNVNKKKLSDNMIISELPLENNTEGSNNNYTSAEEDEQDDDVDDNNDDDDDDDGGENNENSEDRYDENNLNTDLNNTQRSWKSPGEKKCVIIPSNRRNSVTLLSKEKSLYPENNEIPNINKSIEIDNLQMTALIQQNKISDVVLNNLKELDLRLLELHKRKMYVEEMILKLQKDNMAIDLAQMQLQNERFLIINSALAKGNISLTTNQLLQSIQGQTINPTLENVLIKTEPLSSNDWLQSTSYGNRLTVGDYISSIFPSSNIFSTNNLLPTNNNLSNNNKDISNCNKRKTTPTKTPFSTPFSEKLRNRKKRCQSDILLEETENILRNSQDNFNIDTNITETSLSMETNNSLVKKSNRIKNNTKIQNKINESVKSLQPPAKKKIKLSLDNSKLKLTNSEISTIDNELIDNNYNDNNENLDTSHIENGSFEGFKLPITQIRTIGDYIIVSSEDGNIYKFCWHNKELLAKFTKHTEAVIQFFIDSNCFIYSISLDGYLKKTSCENFGLEMQSVNLQEPLQSIDIQWNLAFIGSRWGNIFVYNIKDNKLSETLLYSVGSSIMALKATKEEQRKVLIISSKGNQINIIDTTSGQLLRIINVPVNYNIYSIILCGNIIYCGSNKNEILSFNFMNGDKIGTMLCGNGAISMKMFKNKQMFVGCYDGFVYVLDKNNGNQIGRFPGSGNMITALDIIGDKILTAAKDNSLKLTDIPNYVLLALEK